MKIEILKAGPMLTVQDQGRYGFASFGVSFAGPMDPPSLALANAMVGNFVDAAALEFAGFGGTFRCTSRVRVAILGGDVRVEIDGREVSQLCAHVLKPGEVLSIGGLRSGVWGYLAISGGINVPLLLGSRSTHLRFALGGLEGRTLRAGDTLSLGTSDPDMPCLQLAALAAVVKNDPIRAVPGPQEDYFDPPTLSAFFSSEFTVTPRFDRMGMALCGPKLAAIGGHDIISDGVVPGAIQVPGSGQPMVLMAESQTTGGYPKIATVIGVDLPRLAQMRPGTPLRFQAVTQAEGETLWRTGANALNAQVAALQPVAKGDLSSRFLLSVNLISGAWARGDYT